MPQANQTGYLAEAQTVAFSGAQNLNTLLVDEYTDLSDQIDNSSSKYLQADFELVVDLDVLTLNEGESLHLYIIPSVDGSNYPEWNGNTTTNTPTNESYYAGSFVARDQDAAQRLILEDIPLPAGVFKVGIRNKCSDDTAASGHTLKWRPKSFGSQ